MSKRFEAASVRLSANCDFQKTLSNGGLASDGASGDACKRPKFWGRLKPSRGGPESPGNIRSFASFLPECRTILRKRRPAKGADLFIEFKRLFSNCWDKGSHYKPN
jgi:hypothetical protein